MMSRISKLPAEQSADHSACELASRGNEHRYFILARDAENAIQRLLGDVDSNDSITHSYDHYSRQAWQGSASDDLVRGVSGMPRPWIPFGMNSGA